jgi:hypothetical protein
VEEKKNTLSCVVEKTHDKQDLCCAFYFRRTAKFFLKNDASFGRSVEEKKYFVVRRGEKRTANKIFAVRFISDAWQSFF